VKDDEKLALWEHIQLGGTIAGILFIGGWIEYTIHPDVTVEK
jgi:hypothetical protein